MALPQAFEHLASSILRRFGRAAPDDDNLDDQPYLVVSGPGGTKFVKPLRSARVTVGRGEDNDVVLHPDPTRSITARAHCVLERRDGAWWVSDHSKNGTLVHQKWEWSSLEKPVQLGNDDIVRIPTSTPHEFWDLTFRDPNATQDRRGTPYLKFALERQRAYVIDGSQRTEIALTPTEVVLLAHMLERNDAHGGPADCSTESLIPVLWPGDAAYGRSPGNVAALVKGLRSKLEPQREGRGRFIVNNQSGGYCLVPRPLPDLGAQGKA